MSHVNLTNNTLTRVSCVEILWRLAPSHCGHGYTTDAATAALKVGFEHPEVPQSSHLREHCLYKISRESWVRNVA
ncbi:MAG: GNAT family N-acetyltransferase [Pseudomonadales bacterium]|nr:GNAT family N-acetyltransferase [Pseudomonadales bacterium]